ncbi:Mediator of RNA polymerase II transcription subunit [Lachnellula hyalina]|uniref:Mediator of RNA polymerase II transcription subunit 8 n=1 Tax=Lachnellula hyalina TaxID=1316788 RepID=A0A8H8QZB6_9HELO|nr:Mediator of RNA polymerase II transcription subunit [Lachnellula hyalina]TVY25652.1 Mediator of RNA polymerase II transcription subunit [Lachnellula hyalina]
MAQAALITDDIKALEQTRQRLYQLKSNIISLQTDVMRSNPLPQWSSLQASISILVTNIETLTTHLSKNADQLNRTVVYPSTNYPGRTQEALLGQLLRKKLEPSVEGWVAEGRAIQDEAEQKGGDEEELWDWARSWLGPRLQKYAMQESSDNYTAEERAGGIESVNTGLRRKLEDNHHDSDEEDEEDEDEDDEMEDVTTDTKGAGSRDGQFGMGEVMRDPAGKARSEDDILRFAMSGAVLEGVQGIRR